MAVNIQMFGSLMKSVVVSYMPCRLGVTKEACNIVDFDAEIFEKVYKPLYFTTCGG